MFAGRSNAFIHLRKVLTAPQWLSLRHSLAPRAASAPAAVATPSKPERHIMAAVSEAADGVKKVVVSCAAVAAMVIVATAVVQDLLRDTIVIEPVSGAESLRVNGLDGQSAAEKIGFHLRSVQQRSVEDRRRLLVDDKASTFDFQVPGSTFTFTTAVRYVAGLMSKTRPVPQVDLAVDSDGIKANVRMMGRTAQHQICVIRGPAQLEELYGCIARHYLRFLDPMAAAMDRFYQERTTCAAPTGANAANRDPLEWRRKCAFAGTQELIAEALKTGDAADIPWAWFLYGQIHVARAEAFKHTSFELQLSELEQAIGLFHQALAKHPQSVAVLTNLANALLRRAVLLHESVGRTRSLGQQHAAGRLDLATLTLQQTLDTIARARRTSDPSRQLTGLTAKLEAHARYRMWMVAVHRKTGSPDVAVDCVDTDHMANVVGVAEQAIAFGVIDFSLFMTIGNAERARCRFDQAVAAYRHAAEVAPGQSEPWLNIAITYLEAAVHRGKVGDIGDLLRGLGSVSAHLLWASDGGPYPNVSQKIQAALKHHGREDVRQAFTECYEDKAYDGDPDRGVKHLRLLDGCVAKVVEQLKREPEVAELVGPTSDTGRGE
ncbi:MAG TPA: hypothetical protein VJ890_28890 [Vineibacter sp.]|nr:hypothetical protein [Vineibacter sp.]